MSIWKRVGQELARIAVRVGTEELSQRFANRGAKTTEPKPKPTKPRRKPAKPTHEARNSRPEGGYLGDYTGPVTPEYDPYPDNDPDPGEVVWAWVPYEEDHNQGKDRPVVVLARRPQAVLALALTSKDHDRDGGGEIRAGRHWLDIGTGAWDRKRRPSEVRLDRVLHLRISDVRREGCALDRDVFEAVVAAAADANGWPGA